MHGSGPCECNSSYSFLPILLKLHIYLNHDLKIYMCLLQNLEIIFFHASVLWKCICSRYLLSATPPTVLNRSFWNFTDVLIMLWRYACAFYRILLLIVFTFFTFLIDFFALLQVCSGGLVSATPPTVFYRSFWNFTGILIMIWRYPCGFYRILIYIFFNFSHF